MNNHKGSRLILVTVFVMTALVVLISLSACTGRGPASGPARIVTGGDPNRGWQALQDYGCVSCHTIPGVPGANALVGPPLNDWADRRYIAGRLINTPENLMVWIQFPQDVDPGNAMPDMGVGDEDARDMAAYLYTLQRGRWFERWGP